jgi:hypothetical protein
MVLVGVDDRAAREPTTQEWHKARWVNFATMANEHHSFSIPHAQWSSMTTVPTVITLGVRAGEWIASLLHHKPPVMRRLGRLDTIGLYLSVVPQLAEHVFHFVGVDSLFFHATSHRDKEERCPHGNALVGKQCSHGIDLLVVASSDRRIHLNGHSKFPRVTEHGKSTFETTFPASKRVVRLGVRTIKADTQPANAGVACRLERLSCGQRRC